MSESSGDAVAAPPTVAAVMRGSCVTLLVSHGMWSTWTRLAIGHERDAWMARAEGLKSGAPDAYVPEFQSALQAVTQAAFALDGLVRCYLRDALQRTGTATGRYVGQATVRIPETSDRKEDPLIGLIEGRRDVAIPVSWSGGSMPKATTGSKHPLASGIVPQEYALFKAEAASRAMNMVRAVFEGCLATPTPALRAWSKQASGLLSELLDMMPPRQRW